MHNQVHSVFEFPYIMSDVRGDSIFLDTYLESMSFLGNSRSVAHKLFNLLPSKFVFYIFTKKSQLFFLNNKFPDIVEGLHDWDRMVAGGMDIKTLWSRRHNVLGIPSYFFYRQVFLLYLYDSKLESKKSQSFINATVKWMKKCGFRFCIVTNDSLFVERFLLHCARIAGLSSIVIQHGIFSYKTDERLVEGKFTDIFFAWSEGQKRLLMDKGIASEKIRILGYPYNYVRKSHKPRQYTIKTKKVCVLGQPWENYDKLLGMRKLEIFKKAITMLDRGNMQYCYKPHPGENDEKYLPDNVEIFYGSLDAAFDQFDIFISLTSTALLEVSIHNKIAIQLFDNQFTCADDHAEEYCYSLPVENLHSLVQFIESITAPVKPSSESIVLHHDIGKKFADLLGELSNDFVVNH